MRRLVLACLPFLLAVPALAQLAETDLCLEKTVEDRETVIGREATFFIAVTNVGTEGATGVAVADVLPDGLAFVAASATAGDYDAATGSWALGALAPGQTATLTITTIVTAATPVENCAALQALDQHDRNPENDRDCATVLPQPVDPDGLAVRLEAR